MRVACGLLALLVPAAASGTPFFTGVGFLPGGNTSVALAVSGDGSTVAGGTSAGYPNRAFRWTASGGMVELEGFQAEARDVSIDGSTAVGTAAAPDYASFFPWPAVWSGTSFAYLDVPFELGWANAVSADGSRVAGVWATPVENAVVWNSGTASPELVPGIPPPPPGGFFEGSSAQGISSDGAAVVGWYTTSTGRIAFQWEVGSAEATTLPYQTGLGTAREAHAVSDLHPWMPGSGFLIRTIVGLAETGNGSEAFRWRITRPSEPFLVGLGDLPGGAFDSVAYDLSADGSVVVGRGTSDRGPEAFVWTEELGMRALRELLADDLGLDLEGWQLTSASGISADGRIVVGTGVNPQGLTEAWIASIPEPSSIGLAAVALALTISARAWIARG